MAVGAFGSGAVELGVGYVTVLPSARGFSKELDKQIAQAGAGASKAGERAGQQMSSGMSKALKVGGAAAGAAAVAGIGVAITKGFSRLNQIDQAESKLRGLKLEAGDVTRVMDGVSKAVTGTAFGLGEAATAAAKLASANVAVGDDMDRVLKLTADIASQAGTSMDDISSIMAKITGSGKLTGETLAQLDERAVGAAGALSKHLGISIEEVREQISKGNIDLETFQVAMEEHLGGAALKSGETMQGAFNNMMAAVGRLGEAMLKPFMGEGKGVMATLTDLVNTLTKKVGPAMESFAGWLANTAVPALRTAGEWIQRNRDWLEPLAVAIGAAATAWAVWTGAIKLWAGIVKVGIAIQAAWNAVMAANPIMLAVMAIGALVAGLTYFFTQTETGKAIWDSFTTAMAAGWAFVQNAFAVAWAFIQPIFTQLWGIIQTVGEVFVNVVKAYFVAYWNILSSVISFVWNSVIKPVWDAMKVGLQALGAYFQWVWTAVIQPAWNALGAGISYVWTSVINPAWNALKAALGAVGTFFQMIWNSVIKPAWDALGNGIRTVVNNVIMPAWDVMKRGLDTIKNHFSTAVDAIKSVWESLSGALRKPIDFLVNVVWNRGLVPAWNTVQSFLPDLPRANPMPAFATGGAVHGPGTGTSDSIMARLSAGEHVLTAAEVKALGGHRVLYAIRALIKRGTPFNWDQVQGLSQWPASSLRGLTRSGKGDLGMPAFAEGGEVRPAWMAQLENGHRAAKMRNGNPYTWGFEDCSGYMSMIADAIINGGNGVRRWATGSFPGGQPWRPGLGPGFSVGVHDNPGGPGGGHTSGTLQGVGQYGTTNVESGGGHGYVAYGGPAAGADHPQWNGVSPGRFHLGIGADGAFESGGGPSPESQRNVIKEKIKEILDKALEPIKSGMSARIGSPPPPYLDIPPQSLTRTKDTAVDMAFDMVEKVGDKLRSVYDAAKGVTATITGLFRDKGGFIPNGKSIVNNETGKPEAVLNWDQLQQVIRLMESAAGLAALQEWAHGDPTAAIAQGVSEDTVKAVEAVGERIAAEVAVMTDTFEKTWRDGMLEDALGVFGVGQVGGTVGAAMKALADPDLLKAKAFWEANGWYDQGGWLQPGLTLTRNDTGKPEAILNPAQWSMISRQIDVVEQVANGASGATYNVYANDLDEAMKRLRLREAQRAQTYVGAR